jgi:hypothetical protein
MRLGLAALSCKRDSVDHKLTIFEQRRRGNPPTPPEKASDLPTRAAHAQN